MTTWQVAFAWKGYLAARLQGSPEYLRRLDGDILRLRERLGIASDQPDWDEGDDSYKVRRMDLSVCLNVQEPLYFSTWGPL